MKNPFFVYADKRNWYRYLIPIWMNPVSWEYELYETRKKIWRWLIWGWTTN